MKRIVKGVLCFFKEIGLFLSFAVGSISLIRHKSEQERKLEEYESAEKASGNA